MDLRFLLLMGLACLVVPATQAQDAESSRFQDAFLDDLTGEWVMTGHVMGDSVQYDAEAQWVLGHQFLRLQMTDVTSPPEYAAHVYIGHNPAEKEYVAHWLDTSGGGASTTLGHGERTGDRVTFRFDYPDGPFRTTFERSANGRWRVQMRSKEESGEWSSFADFVMTPASDS